MLSRRSMLSTFSRYAAAMLGSFGPYEIGWAKSTVLRDTAGKGQTLDITTSRPLFEPVIISLLGVSPLQRPSFATRDPIPALFHRAGEKQRKLLIYVPGGVPGAPLCGPYDYNVLATHLAEIGYSLVVPQMSTSQKPAPSPLENCVEDIQSVLAWAQAEGFDHVALAGNGLGAARIVYWAAQEFDAVVKTLVLLSPVESPYLAIERCGSSQRKDTRDTILQSCRSLIAAGRGKEIVEADLDGGRRAYTAEGFVDCFGAPGEARTTMVRFADQISVPTAIIHGDDDPIAPPDGASAMLESLVKVSRKELVWISGGKHGLLASPSTVEATSIAVCAWLAGV